LHSRAQTEVVAVKKIEYAQGPEEAMQAFHHEITAMWSLSFHPNVITLIAYDDSTTSIVTPLYDGDLDFFLHNDKNHRLNLDDTLILYISLCIGRGMNAVHDMGIIHRDMKSGNILIKFRPGFLPEIVICDFGIARIAENHAIINQKRYELFGLSPRYAAPETFARIYMKSGGNVNEDAEKKADVFSYGIVLWEILTQQVPWVGLSTEEIELNVRSGKTLPEPQATTQVQGVVQSLYKACCANEPTARPFFNTIVQNLQMVAEQFQFKF